MRRLLVTTFLTLDGVMQAPGGPGEDDSGGFTHGGWSMTYWDDVMARRWARSWASRSTSSLGAGPTTSSRRTGPTHPRQTAPSRSTTPPSTLRRAASPCSTWGRSGASRATRPRHRGAQAGDGPELQVHGSGNLIQTLLRHNLVDEFHLWVFPVVLGTGKRLFADGAVPGGLKLVDTKVSTTGVVIGTYEPAGELVTGTVGR